MEFSVVIPLYNKEKSIERAVRSVLAQTHQEFEIIIINDGSTDDSLVNAQKIVDFRINIFSQANMGVSVARNVGISKTEYNLIAFLDADDEWHPKFLEKICVLINTFPECGVFASAYWIVKKDGSKIRPFVPYSENFQTILDDVIEHFRLYYPFNTSSVVVEKEKLIEVGGFPEGLKGGEDVVTWLKLSSVTKFAFVNSPLSVYRQDAENRAMDRVPPYDFYPPAKYLDNLLKEGDLDRKYRKSAIEYIVKHQLTSAKRFVRKKEPLKAIKAIWTCKNTRQQWLPLLRVLVYAIISIFIPSLSNRV